MSKTVIRVENIGKRYHLRGRQLPQASTRAGAIKNTLLSPFSYLRSTLRQPDEAQTLWALRNISFEVKQGEIIGFIGRNGAGKSTLLKILSRITRPTEGIATIEGRVGSLIEVGTGFHPELTGRENLYLNGTILGMRKAEIDARFDEIVEFSGTSKFLDTPVKYYSSGMYVRLGFAVAAHLQPEILLVVEVVSVGDAEFQKRSIGRMERVAQEGRTVFFVSHNMATIENLCHRVIVMKNGRIDFDGETRAGIAKYIGEGSTPNPTDLEAVEDRTGTGEAIITDFHLEDEHGQPVRYVPSGFPVTLVLGYKVVASEPLERVVPSFAIKSIHGAPLILHRSNFVATFFDPGSGRGEFRCVVPRLPLAAGSYRVDGTIEVRGEIADNLIIGRLQVIEGDFFGTGHAGMPHHSPILMDGEWQIRQ